LFGISLYTGDINCLDDDITFVLLCLKSVCLVFVHFSASVSLQASIIVACLDVKSIKLFVLDEADEMLSRGFKDQIYDVFRLLPDDAQAQIIYATICLLNTTVCVCVGCIVVCNYATRCIGSN
jgi:hypothetical protein